MADPKLTILELIKGGWSLSITPTYSADWVQEKASFPQVVVSHIVTNPHPTGFSENPASENRRIEASFAVDVWSRDAPERWDLLEEVDRVLKSKCGDPGSGLESLTVSAWTDMDIGSTRPPLYRSRLRLEVLYYG